MPNVLKGFERRVVFVWGTVESRLMKSTFFSPGTRAQSVGVCKYVTSSLCNGEGAGSSWKSVGFAQDRRLCFTKWVL